MQTKVTQALVRARLEGNLFEIPVCLSFVCGSQGLTKVLPVGGGGEEGQHCGPPGGRLEEQARRAFGCQEPPQDGVVQTSQNSQTPGKAWSCARLQGLPCLVLGESYNHERGRSSLWGGGSVHCVLSTTQCQADKRAQ